jgi:membrane-bound ClpP family serine protease
MGLIGDFTKGILILTVAGWIFLIIEFTAIGQTIPALLLLIGFLIPSFMIIYEYKKFKKSKNQQAIHNQ